MTTRELPIHDAEYTALLQNLRREHFKWDIFADGQPTVGRDAIVLEREEHEFLVATAQALSAEIIAMESITHQRSEYREALALSEASRETDIPSEIALPEGPRSIRVDFHYTIDKEWVAVECNSDLPGGIVEIAGMTAELSRGEQNILERMGDVTVPGDIATAFQRAFQPYSHVGLVYDTAFSTDLQHVECLRRWLEQEGHTTVVGGPGALGYDDVTGFTMKGIPLQGLYRFYPAELIGELPNAAVWQMAAGRLPCCNPLSAGISQSKRLLALSDPATSQALHQYMPLSVLPERLAPGQLEEERERWVVKTAYGRMGDGIAFGIDYLPEQWQRVVAQVYQSPKHFVVQERFDTSSMWFSGGVGYPVVGVHLIDGEFAAYFSRYDTDQIIRDGARYVPTLVRVS
jgi:glutathionylspermidine synthase